MSLNLEKSVGSWFLAQPLDSTALQKNARLTEWVRLRFFQSTVKPIACTIIPCPTDPSRLKHCLIRVIFVMMGISSTSVFAVERLFWDKVPLRITLPVGKERLVTFPAEVRVGMPGSISSKLRTQSNQGTIYWKASEAFDTQRIEVREVQSNRIYLIDLKASIKANSVTPIKVIFKEDREDTEDKKSPDSSSKITKKTGYIELTRYAAQQLYAPARLLKASTHIHRVSIARHTTTHLIHGEQVEATPVASWQSGSLYVTAVELKNISNHYINLDPRHLRGEWRTATFQHIRIHPSGSESDTTSVYLISDRPFHEVM